MAFIQGHEFIVENNLGMIFNFYLNEEKHIEYIVSDEKGKWKEKGLVFNELTESLHLDIDDNDNIYIISYSGNGCLYYHEYINETWANHLIVQYPAAEQKVFYPIIKNINKEIHIFYYLLGTKEKNKIYLLHLKFNNGKYSSNHITTTYSHEYINPFKIFVDDNEILLLYTSVTKGHEQVFVSRSDIFTGQWTEPLCITSSKDKKIYMDGLLDSDKILHLIWSRYDEEHLLVQYLKVDVNIITEGEINKLEAISLSSESSSSFPVIIYYKKVLWVIWTEMGKLISSYTLDRGENWSEAYNHEDTKKIDFKRYRYITSSIDSKNNILCDFVFGTLYPNIKFLGFGGENNDEISRTQ